LGQIGGLVIPFLILRILHTNIVRFLGGDLPLSFFAVKITS
jgi:hypothetical protein